MPAFLEDYLPGQVSRRLSIAETQDSAAVRVAGCIRTAA